MTLGREQCGRRVSLGNLEFRLPDAGTGDAIEDVLYRAECQCVHHYQDQYRRIRHLHGTDALAGRPVVEAAIRRRVCQRDHHFQEIGKRVR